MKLKIYNTQSRSKEIVLPSVGKSIRMYTCGPTVYNYAHIGNLRTYIFEDLLRRTIKLFGMPITQVMNLTDVDDKTIKGATTEGLSLLDFTKKYKDAFFEDLSHLNIEPAEHYPVATDYIPEMIQMIEQLIKKGVAYKRKDACVYFAIAKFSNYGCLSHLNLDDLQVGASERINSDEYDKENLADFVLWKAYDAQRDGNIYWESPFGKGRPGWHLECSAMAMKILGESIDIHCGGVDNIFPHHENEIAQSETCSGKQFSKLWVHSEHLIVDNKKMSKSLGNFYTLRQILSKGYSERQMRYMLLQTHYRTQLNFTFEGLDAAKSSLDRLQDFVHRLLRINSKNNTGKVQEIIPLALENFHASLADDINISAALAAIFDTIRTINTLCDSNELSTDEAALVLDMMRQFNAVLGVLSFELPNLKLIPKEIHQAMKDREEARLHKNWSRADELRDFITHQGYLLEDSPNGPICKPLK